MRRMSGHPLLARHNAHMQRRWIIRGIFIVLLLFSVAVWGLAHTTQYYSHYLVWCHAPYISRPPFGRIPSRTSAIGLYDSVIYIHVMRGPPNIPALYTDNMPFGFMSGRGPSGEIVINPHAILGETRLARLQLKLGFDLRLSSFPPSGKGCAIMFPVWFFVLLSANVLAIAWYRTRIIRADHAFTIEPLQKPV